MASNGCCVGPTLGAVADAQFDGVVAKPLQASSGDLHEFSVPLDCVHARGDAAHDGGGVTRARADLEHAIATLEFGRFDHGGHHEGLRDGLPRFNRQRTIFVGVFN